MHIAYIVIPIFMFIDDHAEKLFVENAYLSESAYAK